MKTLILVVIATVTAIGCATQQVNLDRRSDLEICSSYGVYRTGILSSTAPQYMSEIKRRSLLTDEEIDLVARKAIRVGMSQCALYASWGRPERENRTVFSAGVRIQHIYDTGYRYIKPKYVYTTNGKVSAWQD